MKTSKLFLAFLLLGLCFLSISSCSNYVEDERIPGTYSFHGRTTIDTLIFETEGIVTNRITDILSNKKIIKLGTWRRLGNQLLLKGITFYYDDKDTISPQRDIECPKEDLFGNITITVNEEGEVVFIKVKGH